jgi:DnaK suppressor protein
LKWAKAQEMTKNDFEEIRQQLITKRQEILQRVSDIQKDLRNEDNPPEKDFEEQAVQMENEEVLNALDAEGRATLRKIGHALQRIEAGNYGICAVCDTRIPIERLRAMPYTELCVDCAAEAEE